MNIIRKSSSKHFNYKIQKISGNSSQIQESLELIKRVFMEFEAPQYTAEGVAEFMTFISNNNIKEMIDSEKMFFWCCLDGDRVVGVIASRLPCHISLLFVDSKYHRQGIAKNLYNEFITYYKNYSQYQEVTVNSSPYAVEIYKQLGFIATDIEQITNGIRYTPMKHKFR